MSRGKYAARAENRRASEEQLATAARQTRQIQELTTERDALKATLADARKAHAEESRTLRAQRDEATGPEVVARDRVIRGLQELNADWAAKFDKLEKQRNRLHDELVGWFIAQGQSMDDAFDTVAGIMTGEPVTGAPVGMTSPRDAERLARMTPEQVAALKAHRPWATVQGLTTRVR